MSNEKEPTWIVDVAQGVTKGNYKGFDVVVKSNEDTQVIYLNDRRHATIKTRSPVKAVNTAMAAIDQQLTSSI